MKRGRKSKFYDEKINIELWNAALYIRLSREDGDKAESNSVANQRELLKLFIKENPTLNLYDYYIDDGFTGTNFERPSFKRMIQDIEDEKINCVIVKDLSRLGRNFTEVGNYIQNYFLKNQIRFISVCDDVDSYLNQETIEGFLLPLKNLINEMYAQDISKKVSSAFETMKKEGKYIGGTPPFGYIKDPKDKHHLVVDEASASVVKMIFDLCESGLGNKLIADELNSRCVLTPSEYNYKILKITSSGNRISKEWTASIVAKILDNRAYCGDVVQGKTKKISFKINKRFKNDSKDYIIVENMHTAIIDKERFYRLQEIRKERKYNWNKRIEDLSMFDEILKCDNCKNALKLIEIKNDKSDIKKYAFVCDKCNEKGKKDYYITADKLKVCILRSIKYHIDLLDNFENAKKAVKHNTNYTKQLKENVNSMKLELEDLDKSKLENYENWKNDNLTEIEYIDKLKENVTKEYNLKNEITNTKQELLIAKQNIKDIRENEWVDVLLRYKNQKSITKEMLENLIEEIRICKDGRKIMIKFKYEDPYLLAMKYLRIVKKGGDINV